MVGTVDLLLSLGSKIADILMLLLNKRVSKSDREEAQRLVEQYDQLKQAHLQITSIIEQYNQGIVKALATGNLQDLYPQVDLAYQFAKIEAWCLSNEKKRKTRNGATRFINGWMGKAADKLNNNGVKNPTPDWF